MFHPNSVLPDVWTRKFNLVYVFLGLDSKCILCRATSLQIFLGKFSKQNIRERSQKMVCALLGFGLWGVCLRNTITLLRALSRECQLSRRCNISRLHLPNLFHTSEHWHLLPLAHLITLALLDAQPLCITPPCPCTVYSDGRVCISILHPPGDDPTGYEHSSERWSPVQSIEKILLSVVSMLSEPNDESGANIDASKMWRENRQKFNQVVDLTVRKSLGLA